MKIAVEVRRPEDMWWIRSQDVLPGDRPGSLHSEKAGDDRVYMFGQYQGMWGVWELTKGTVLENQDLRLIAAERLILLADLEKQSFELDIRNPDLDGGHTLCVRFTLMEDDG